MGVCKCAEQNDFLCIIKAPLTVDTQRNLSLPTVFLA